jgi:endonuclease/exonuclease/phosphatase family metal-dependent hydrolase
VLWDRRRVDLIDHRTRWFGAEPHRPGSRLPGARFPRVATWCRLRLVGSGRVLDVVSTHLDAADRANRLTSTEQLASWLDPAVPTVVLGDLNATPDSGVVTALAAAGLRDALVEVEGGTVHGFTGRTDGRRIDHILVSEHLAVTAAAIDHARRRGRLPSDHWPVVAQLRFR